MSCSENPTIEKSIGNTALKQRYRPLTQCGTVCRRRSSGRRIVGKCPDNASVRQSETIKVIDLEIDLVATIVTRECGSLPRSAGGACKSAFNVRTLRDNARKETKYSGVLWDLK